MNVYASHTTVNLLRAVLPSHLSSLSRFLHTTLVVVVVVAVDRARTNCPRDNDTNVLHQTSASASTPLLTLLGLHRWTS